MMRRDECLEVLHHLRKDAVVVPVYHAAFDWMRISPSPLNFFGVGAMGQASSLALGFAIGLPNRKVIVIDGDGSLLMNLGSLVTVAAEAPGNLYHFVCENGCYEANGSHPIPARDKVDFAAMAKSAGYPHSFAFDDLDTFRGKAPAILALDGPVFATLKVVPGARSEMNYRTMHGAEARRLFKKAVMPA